MTAMDALDTALLHTKCIQIDDPDIRETGGSQQPRESLCVCHMGLLQIEATAFLVREERLNGMITNDKFCCTRWGQLQLSWWRRPLRLRQESDHERIS